MADKELTAEVRAQAEESRDPHSFAEMYEKNGQPGHTTPMHIEIPREGVLERRDTEVKFDPYGKLKEEFAFSRFTCGAETATGLIADVISARATKVADWIENGYRDKSKNPDEDDGRLTIYMKTDTIGECAVIGDYEGKMHPCSELTVVLVRGNDPNQLFCVLTAYPDPDYKEIEVCQDSVREHLVEIYLKEEDAVTAEEHMLKKIDNDVMNPLREDAIIGAAKINLAESGVDADSVKVYYEKNGMISVEFTDKELGLHRGITFDESGRPVRSMDFMRGEKGELVGMTKADPTDLKGREVEVKRFQNGCTVVIKENGQNADARAFDTDGVMRAGRIAVYDEKGRIADMVSFDGKGNVSKEDVERKSDSVDRG